MTIVEAECHHGFQTCLHTTDGKQRKDLGKMYARVRQNDVLENSEERRRPRNSPAYATRNGGKPQLLIQEQNRTATIACAAGSYTILTHYTTVDSGKAGGGAGHLPVETI